MFLSFAFPFSFSRRSAASVWAHIKTGLYIFGYQKAVTDQRLPRFRPFGGWRPMWACYPMGRCHMGLRNGSIYESKRRVRGTALGLLAVPTKLGNPGG